MTLLGKLLADTLVLTCPFSFPLSCLHCSSVDMALYSFPEHFFFFFLLVTRYLCKLKNSRLLSLYHFQKLLDAMYRSDFLLGLGKILPFLEIVLPFGLTA